jgi:hypothetical protein
MSKVVTLTFDANMAPAVRKFIEAKDAIRKVKDEAKGLTDQVGKVTQATEKQATESQKYAQGQLGEIKSMVMGWAGIAAAIRVATDLMQTYKAGQQAAISAGEQLGPVLQKLNAVAGSNSAIAQLQAKSAAFKTGTGIVGAYKARTEIEASTDTFESRFGVQGANIRRGELTESALQLQGLYGDAGQEKDFAGALGTTADLYTGSVSSADISNAAEIMLRNGASPEEVTNILRSFAGKNGGKKELSSAVSFYLSTQGTQRGARQTMTLIAKLEGLDKRQRKRLGIGETGLTAADAGVLSGASDKALNAAGFSGDELDSIRRLKSFGTYQSTYDASALNADGSTEDATARQYRISTLGAGGQMILGQRDLERAKNTQLEKEGELAANAARAQAAKITSEGTSTAAKVAGSIVGPIVDPVRTTEGAQALQSNKLAAQQSALEEQLNAYAKDKTTNTLRTTGVP